MKSVEREGCGLHEGRRSARSSASPPGQSVACLSCQHERSSTDREPYLSPCLMVCVCLGDRKRHQNKILSAHSVPLWPLWNCRQAKKKEGTPCRTMILGAGGRYEPVLPFWGDALCASMQNSKLVSTDTNASSSSMKKTQPPAQEYRNMIAVSRQIQLKLRARSCMTIKKRKPHKKNQEPSMHREELIERYLKVQSLSRKKAGGFTKENRWWYWNQNKCSRDPQQSFPVFVPKQISGKHPTQSNQLNLSVAYVFRWRERSLARDGMYICYLCKIGVL